MKPVLCLPTSVCPPFIKVVILIALIISISCSPGFVQTRRAKHLYKEGQILLSQGKREEATVRFEKSLSLARAAGFPVGVAHNLNEMAIIHTSKGRYKKARKLLFEAVNIYKEAGMDPEVSKSLNNIALTYVREYDLTKAVNRYEELLKWDRETNNLLGTAITLYNMGLLYDHYLGKYEEAQRSYLEALKIFTRLEDKRYIQTVDKKILRLMQEQNPENQIGRPKTIGK